jgi:hypothetical protein
MSKTFKDRRPFTKVPKSLKKESRNNIRQGLKRLKYEEEELANDQLQYEIEKISEETDTYLSILEEKDYDDEEYWGKEIEVEIELEEDAYNGEETT